MNIFDMDTYKIKKLVDHAHDPAQHDAIMTELATVNAEEAGLFLNGLLSRGEREPTLKVLLTLLAAYSLLHIKKVAASTEKNVLQQLSKIVPPRKAAQARELASAGDLAVVPIERYLARRGKDLDKPCAYCVRTLALIGSPAALKVLEIYAQALCPPHSSAYRTGYAKGGEVYAELLHALPHFNRQEYLQRVLARYLRTAETLLLDGAYDLEGVPPPPALHTVEWWNTGKLGDLRPLAAWPQLCQVTLSDCFGLRDVKALTALPTLRRLHLHRTDPGRLKGFSELRNLERLSLENTGSEKKSLECIAQLTGLQTLSLSSWHLEDISALKSLTNLRELWLQGGPNLKDISVIGRLPELRQLSIGEINPQQLCEIPGLARLEQLELNGCQIKKLTGLGRLTGLRTLSMRGSSDLQHVSGLEELMNLQTLSISDCPQLQHVSGIENLVNLQTLEITGREANQLSEMSPLGSLTNLRAVDLRACQNLKKVDGLPQLLAL
ncbi:MAG TPA: leucine-rich repeat domain-containing protein, partial [Ktedonobacteraceae bacterium]|nr:leucine-rich repeat domain-containing protein [Ktedonobacteraceae bacterium]